jgi:tetratricopeptide (TPR) repeat protein
LYTAPVGKIRTDADKLSAKSHDAYDLFQQKKFDECMVPLKEIIRMMPENTEAWTLLGYCHLYKGEKEKAKEVFEKVIEMDSTEINAMYNLACVHATLGNSEESLKWLKKAIEGNDQYRKHAKGDDDFANIRDTEEFKNLVG